MIMSLFTVSQRRLSPVPDVSWVFSICFQYGFDGVYTDNARKRILFRLRAYYRENVTGEGSEKGGRAAGHAVAHSPYESSARHRHLVETYMEPDCTCHQDIIVSSGQGTEASVGTLLVGEVFVETRLIALHI